MRSALYLLGTLLLVLALLGAGCTAPTPSATSATPTATPSPVPTVTLTPDEQRVQGFVTEAVEYARSVGKEKALAEFNDPNGTFTRGDLYIFADDYNGTCLATPALPGWVGTDRMNETDVIGTPFIQREIVLAKSGGGFITVHFPNPARELLVEPKRCYVLDVDGTYFIGSGVYHPDTAVTPSPVSTVTLTPDEQRVQGFVTEAVEYARSVGKEKALAEFNDPNGTFIRDDLYIFAADYQGISLASIALPQRVNTSFYNDVDVTGQYYMRNKINLSKSGGGFIIIHFPNPAHGMAPEPKLCYVHDVDGTYWVGAGTYGQGNRTTSP